VNAADEMFKNYPMFKHLETTDATNKYELIKNGTRIGSIKIFIDIKKDPESTSSTSWKMDLVTMRFIDGGNAKD
jgi:hypothetical protein